MRLSPKPFAAVRIKQVEARNQLNGHATAARFINRLIHHPHAAAPHLANNSIFAQANRVRLSGRIPSSDLTYDCFDLSADNWEAKFVFGCLRLLTRLYSILPVQR